MVTESHKEGNRRWDRDNMRSLSCRLRTDEAEDFKEWCKLHNTNPGAYLKQVALRCVDEYNAEMQRQYELKLEREKNKE